MAHRTSHIAAVAGIILLTCLNTKAFSQVVLHDQFPNLSFASPVGIYEPGDGTDRLFVVEQEGLIRVFTNDTLATSANIFLDMRDSTVAGGELGLLGLAFHPQYATNGYFYVDYTRGNPLRSIIARFRVSSTNPDSAERNSELVLIDQAQPYNNHNGGQIAFGPDGYLYVAFGDGGSSGDPQGNGQDKSTMLGKILRINVDSASGGEQYSIPPDNPFYDNDSGFTQEIYALGFRNPWRFSFDASTLWAADVGQNKWEEIDTVVNGGNYGWKTMEGAHCYSPLNCDQTGLSLPVWEYFHDSGRCSVTGGFVYRGSSAPSLYGKYVYGDICSGEIWSLTPQQAGSPANVLVVSSGKAVSSFGVDKFRELYLCSYYEGKIYKFTSPVPPLPVTLLSPSDSAGGLPSIVTCLWTFSAGAASYHLQVATDSTFSSPAVDDSTLQDTSRQAGPLANATKYYWRVRARNVYGSSAFTASRTFTTAAFSANYFMRNGWNLISLPLEVSDARVSELFPSAASDAFRYDPASGYATAETLIAGAGYWIKFSDSMTISVTGSPKYADTIDIVTGWNMIGSISDPVSVGNVIQEPSGILISNFFEYLGSYQKTSVLAPTKGYWVKANAPGKVILQVAGMGSAKNTRQIE